MIVRESITKEIVLTLRVLFQANTRMHISTQEFKKFYSFEKENFLPPYLQVELKV